MFIKSTKYEVQQPIQYKHNFSRNKYHIEYLPKYGSTYKGLNYPYKKNDILIETTSLNIAVELIKFQQTI